MVTTTEEEYRQAIEEMLEIFESLPQISVRARNARLVEVAYGWSIQIHRFARAILQLSDSGFANEARVLVRSMLEYTITLQWLVEVGDSAIDAAIREHQRSLKAATEQADLGMELPEEVIRKILDLEIPPVAEQATLRRFEQICKDLGVAHNLYIVYRVESSVTHPTLAAATEYLVEQPGEQNLGFVTRPTGIGGAAIALAAHCLVWAGRSLDSVLNDRPLRDPLKRIARRIDAAPVLPHRLPSKKPPPR